MVVGIYSFVSVILFSLSSRFIFGGDSAEFAAISHTWSIPHPPGYPLYSLLLNVITHLIPIGTIPWRASLLSSIPTILTSYLLFKILIQIKIRRIVALVSSLLYIVLFPVWEYALVPEVFALNSLLVVATSYFLLRYRDTNKQVYLIAASFLIGLCASHHHIFIIFIPGWIVLLRGRLRSIIKSLKKVVSLIAAFILGLSFYLYAPIASSLNPPIQWEDAETPLGFWRLITRAMYGTFTAYGGSKGDIANQLYDVFSLFVFVFQDFRSIGVVCIGIGMWVTVKRKDSLYQFLFISTLVHTFFLFYANFMLSNSFSIAMYERFLISFYAILIIYFGIGFNTVYGIVIRYISRLSDKVSIRQVAIICLTLFLFIYIATVAKTNFRSLSYIKNGTDFDRLGKDIINTVPDGGIFFAGNDNANFVTLYHIFGAHYPTKAIFFQINFITQKPYIDRFRKNNKGLLFPPSLQNQTDVETFIRLNKKRGIYLETPLQNGFWMPYGLLWKYYETKEEGLKDLDAVVKANTHLWNSVYHIPELTIHTRNIMHLQTVQELYINSYMSYSKLLFLAKKNGEAQVVLKNILNRYSPSDKNAKIALINLLLLEKKCSEAKPLVQDVSTAPNATQPPEFISAFIHYYEVCDPKNKQLLLLKKVMDANKNKSLTPLTDF